MIAKWRVKLAMFVLLAPILTGVAVFAFNGLSQFVASFQQGADPASVFRGHTLRVPDPSQARWHDVTLERGIDPTRAQQDELIAAYWRAWQALSRAYETGNPADLSTYWALPALDFARESISPNVTVETAAHKLTLLVFSDDRSVARLHDRFTVWHDEIYLHATATTTLTLDSGRWRIRNVQIDYRLPKKSPKN